MKDSIDPHVSHSIDIIRGMAALGVIWGHAMYDVVDYPIEINGAFWVWIFLCISGYLIAKGFVSGRYPADVSGFTRFLWNRALRIIPLYQLTLLIGLIVVGKGVAEEIGIGATLQQFLFYSPLNNISLSGPMWTVATEVQFYLFSIILIVFLMKFSNGWMPIIVLLASIWISISYIPEIGDNFAQPRTLLGNVPFFVFGMALAFGKVDTKVHLSRIAKLVLICGFILIAWVAYNGPWFASQMGLPPIIGNGLVHMFWAYPVIVGGYHFLGIGSLCAMGIPFVALCACSGGVAWSQRFPALKRIIGFFSWCGFYTYGIYCWHASFLNINSSWLHLSTGPVLTCLVMLFALGAAPLSYKFFEAQWFRYKYRMGNRYTSERA